MERRVDFMTLDDLVTLLRSVDDDADHHILWVSKDGTAMLSPTAGVVPAEFAELNKNRIQFRLESFGRGGGYCGDDVVPDHYRRRILETLKKNWMNRVHGTIDMF